MSQSLKDMRFGSPYLRIELSMKPSKRAGISQHDAPRRLCAIKTADVNYVAIMLFTDDDARRPVDLNDRQVVAVDGAAGG